MKSMTGYGYSERVGEKAQISVELKSYNNRFLEINHNINYMLAPYEIEIDKAIMAVAKRGRVDVNIRLKVLENEMVVHVDEGAVRAYALAFEQISAAASRPLDMTLADFLSQEGVLVTTREDESDTYRPILFEALESALDQLRESKGREGEATKADLIRLGKIIEEGHATLDAHADELEALLKSQLEQRFEEMLGDKGWDESRILQEIGVLLVRYSIHEEIKRLGAHLKEYFSLLESDEPVGKRLDFLCQEMNREINTIGSKSQIVALNMEVVRMKDGLENIREQVRNIE
ncbi:MAG: YicC/YloC family endoribonuclease [Sphaerochaeta sp.]|jgi:uncharacterized protein (TIGR00255 family)|nr:YicC family protein [Spirochaetales bacterium]